MAVPFHSMQMTLHRIPTGEKAGLIFTNVWNSYWDRFKHPKTIMGLLLHICVEKIIKFSQKLGEILVSMLIGWRRCWSLLTLIGCCQDFNSSFLMAIAAKLLREPGWWLRRWWWRCSLLLQHWSFLILVGAVLRLWFFTQLEEVPDDDDDDERVIGVCCKIVIFLLFVETQPTAGNMG